MKKLKKKVTNTELFEFIKENVAMKSEIALKSDFEMIKTGLDSIKADIVSIKADMVKKNDFEQFQKEEFQPLKSTIEKLATKVKKFVDEDYPASLKRISRVDYRTTKILGDEVQTVDAEFEEQYDGEAGLRKAEAEG